MPAGRIVFDHVVQRRLAAVVHVWRARGDRTQGRRLEGELHQLVVLDVAPAAPVGRRCSDVVELIVGQALPAVTAGAIGLAVEQDEATLRRRGHRLLVARDPAIEGACAGSIVRSNAASAITIASRLI